MNSTLQNYWPGGRGFSGRAGDIACSACATVGEPVATATLVCAAMFRDGALELSAPLYEPGFAVHFASRSAAAMAARAAIKSSG